MRNRHFVVAVALMVVAGVSCGRGKSDKDVPTAEMSRALTTDVVSSQAALTALQDSLYRFLGDSLAALLKRAAGTWESYRVQECGAVKVAFAEGSVAPVAQLECWVELTDDRSRFLRHEYNFAR